MIKKTNKRIKITLDPESEKLLNELTSLTNIKNKSIIIRKAIKWYRNKPGMKKSNKEINLEEQIKIAKINWIK